MILKEFEEYANRLNIFKVAYTNIKTKNNLKIKFNNVIVLAIEMDMEILESKPGEKAKNLNKAFYEKFRKITEELSKYLLNNGIESQIAYPNEQLINLPFLGEKSGIGGIGKNGILITPEFGPRVKLSGILTSFEDPSFEFSEKKYKWIKKYCEDCMDCMNYCENEALIKDSNDNLILIGSKCIGSEEGCTYCIEKCPFFEKGYDFVRNDFLYNIQHDFSK